MFFSKSCCRFDSSKVDFTRPEVGQGCIHMDSVQQGPKSRWARSESFGVFGHFVLLVGT